MLYKSIISYALATHTSYRHCTRKLKLLTVFWSVVKWLNKKTKQQWKLHLAGGMLTM
jgi:hypothetical protein